MPLRAFAFGKVARRKRCDVTASIVFGEQKPGCWDSPKLVDPKVVLTKGALSLTNTRLIYSLHIWLLAVLYLLV